MNIALDATPYQASVMTFQTLHTLACAHPQDFLFLFVANPCDRCAYVELLPASKAAVTSESTTGPGWAAHASTTTAAATQKEMQDLMKAVLMDEHTSKVCGMVWDSVFASVCFVSMLALLQQEVLGPMRVMLVDDGEVDG